MSTCFIPAVINREGLARLAGDMGLFRTAEIGVYDAKYSEVICRHIPNVRHICVDTWRPSRNHRSERKLNWALRRARSRLAQYDVRFMIMTSLEAAALIPDDSLDFVYIDALHDEASVASDLAAWEPKVRSGGIVSGHDWGHPGVTAAVKAFAAGHPVEIQSTVAEAESDGIMPSWWWIKNA